jgi:hypothetical protein
VFYLIPILTVDKTSHEHTEDDLKDFSELHRIVLQNNIDAVKSFLSDVGNIDLRDNNVSVTVKLCYVVFYLKLFVARDCLRYITQQIGDIQIYFHCCLDAVLI